MIREFQPADVRRLTGLLAETQPERPPPTAGGLRHWIESHPPRARFRQWVAEEDGDLVGLATARFTWTISPGDVAFLWVGVVEGARGRGLGAELYALADRHLVEHRARRVETVALEGSPGERFAEERGFRRTRTELLLRLDPGAADLSALAALDEARRAEGFRLASLGSVLDRRRELHAVYAAASADIPADEAEDDIRLADFADHVLGDPELDRDGSFVVVHGGRPVALAFVLVDREQGVAVSEMTGTLPEFRGRGLARLAKLATIRWARESGIRELATENDAENAPMLALNRSLGYRVAHTRVILARDLRAAP